MKGVKNEISKASFAKSTLRGVIRKGFIETVDIEKTKLTEHTKQAIKSIKYDLLFVRDKQVVFLLDSKNKVVYDCKSSLGAYLDYFVKQNKGWEVKVLENVHPADLRARATSVDKIASNGGFTL